MLKFNKYDFRTDVENYVLESGVREWKKLKHNPFVLFTDKGVIIKYSLKEVLESDLPKDTQFMVTWAGQWSSSIVVGTILDLALAVKMNPKKDYQII